jgi:hypothetical protein
MASSERARAHVPLTKVICGVLLCLLLLTVGYLKLTSSLTLSVLQRAAAGVEVALAVLLCVRRFSTRAFAAVVAWSLILLVAGELLYGAEPCECLGGWTQTSAAIRRIVLGLMLGLGAIGVWPPDSRVTMTPESLSGGRPSPGCAEFDEPGPRTLSG